MRALKNKTRTSFQWTALRQSVAARSPPGSTFGKLLWTILNT
jgi:hypothetical protein